MTIHSNWGYKQINKRNIQESPFPITLIADVQKIFQESYYNLIKLTIHGNLLGNSDQKKRSQELIRLQVKEINGRERVEQL